MRNEKNARTRFPLCGIGLWFVMLFIAIAQTGVALAGSNKGTWMTAAPAPTKRTEVVAAAVKGKIYVVGGFSEPSLGNLLNFAISTAVEVYDPTTDTWSTKASLPIGLHHAGAAVVDDKLYVIGGFTKAMLSVWHPLGTVYAYDPSKDSWTELAPLPTARGALAVAELGGKLYAISGYDGEKNPEVVEVYDPGTNTWSSAAPLPTPRDHLAAVTVGQRIYAIGGRVGLNYHQNLATVEAYDPTADQWRSVTSMPTARSGITAEVIDGRIYVLGGESGDGTFHENERYDPGVDRWEPMTPIPTARHGLGSAVIEGRLHVLSGGPTPGGSFSNVNEVFVPPALSVQPQANQFSRARVGVLSQIFHRDEKFSIDCLPYAARA